MTIQNANPPAEASDAARPLFGVLVECRELVGRRVADALGDAVGEIGDELEARRQAAGDVAEATRLAETGHHLNALRGDFARRVRDAVGAQFGRRAAPPARRGTIYDDAGSLFPELSLVDDAQISETLLVRTLAARVEAGGGSEFPALQMRVAFLLGKDEIQESANPIGPTAICDALKEICWQIEDAGDVRAAILELLVARLVTEIAAIYRDVNALLVARKVMPGARVKATRRAARGAHRPPRAGGRLTEAEERTNGIIRQIRSARADGAGPQRPRTGGEADELITLLTRLQKGESGASIGGRTFSLPDDAPDAANVVAALIDAGLGNQLGAVDALVIDVVATLFDYIFDDTRVPGPIKGLIGRLQIPILKLAMIDHGFFSNRAHPARRLINTLAQAGATWDGEVTPDTSLHRTAEALVLRIQNEFAEDADVFARCLQEFEAYLADQERDADARAATLTERLKLRERHELARETARAAIDKRIAGGDVPALVREFATTTWVKVLMRAVHDGGEDGAASRDAVDTLEQLVWSVQPKADADGRQKLVQRLPALLRAVKAGMKLAAADEGEQKRFFADLVQLHAAALKAGAGAEPAVTSPRAVVGAPTPAADEPTSASLELDLLRRGSWVELRDDAGGVRRVRLTWISPARTMYLFANRQGQRALALTRGELTRRFAAGEAATSSDEALLDRVVDEVLDEYQR